jgi:hypothetical protein
LYVLGLRGNWPFPQDCVGYVVGVDFLNTWFYGKAAWIPDAFMIPPFTVNGSRLSSRNSISAAYGPIRHLSF